MYVLHNTVVNARNSIRVKGRFSASNTKFFLGRHSVQALIKSSLNYCREGLVPGIKSFLHYCREDLKPKALNLPCITVGKIYIVLRH